MQASVKKFSMKDSITSAKASITSVKACMKAFEEVASMEALVKTFVEAPVEVASVEAPVSSISFSEASTVVRGSISEVHFNILATDFKGSCL